MRKVIVGAMVSMDGVMQAPGGPEEDPTGGFKFGGWVAPLGDGDPVFGEELGKLFGEPFDLLLSDIGLPTEDGYALIRRVREIDPAVPAAAPAPAPISAPFPPPAIAPSAAPSPAPPPIRMPLRFLCAALARSTLLVARRCCRPFR